MTTARSLVGGHTARAEFYIRVTLICYDDPLPKQSGGAKYWQLLANRLVPRPRRLSWKRRSSDSRGSKTTKREGVEIS